jgi:hypothetical protein
MNDLFKNSILYIQFADILNDEEEIKDLFFYQNQLDILRSNFNVKYMLPTNKDILQYIENEEYIDDADVPDFIIFVKLIFNKYISMVNKLNKTT